MKIRLLVLAGALLILLSFVVTKSASIPPTFVSPPTASPSEPQATKVLATRVIDGDTIEVEGGTRVRYIGIDTPEPEQCLGGEASAENTNFVGGKKVRLETDIEKRDKYGRLLAYVWVGTTLVNEALLQSGFATVTTYPPNVKYIDRFLTAQKEARDKELGVWSPTACATPTPAGEN